MVVAAIFAAIEARVGRVLGAEIAGDLLVDLLEILFLFVPLLHLDVLALVIILPGLAQLVRFIDGGLSFGGLDRLPPRFWSGARLPIRVFILIKIVVIIEGRNRGRTPLCILGR